MTQCRRELKSRAKLPIRKSSQLLSNMPNPTSYTAGAVFENMPFKKHKNKLFPRHAKSFPIVKMVNKKCVTYGHAWYLICTPTRKFSRNYSQKIEMKCSK